MAEASDDLLLVELVGLQLHSPNGLHGAVVLETLIPGHHHLRGRGLVQLVDVTFLLVWGENQSNMVCMMS